MTFARLTVALVLLLLAAPGDAAPVSCTCPEGNACYHYLNSPVEPPDDPCNCQLCERVSRGGCQRKYPKDWDRGCADNKKVDCFLRRHAVSWKITCSERLSGNCQCKNEHPEWCPSCGPNGHDWGVKEELEAVKRQLGVERRMFNPRKKLVIVKSPHFYVVTDIPKIRVRLQKNPRGKRIARIHEIAHLYAQRAEIAYEEFVEVFGDRVQLPRPVGIYLTQTEGMKQLLATEYFGLPEPELAYGGNWTRIGGGYPYNGMAISYEKYDTDHWLHHMMRHCVGHLLMSCWIKVTGKAEFLPRWAYAGVGHWLSRNPRNLKEMSNFCFGEGQSVKHSGEKWDQMLRTIAADTKSHPIQNIYDVTSLGGLDLEMHQRSWSWFDLYIKEDRKKFVAFLAALRDGQNHRVAMRATLNLSPEEFDRRWRDRILGRRGSMASTPAEIDALNPKSAGAMEREAIRSERDPGILAAKIRALLAVNDPLTAATIVPFLRMEEELVVETIVYVLSRTTSKEVKAWLRTVGLSRYSGPVRAHVARVIADLEDKEAGDALLSHSGDSYWLVRAHVARALGRIRHEPALPRLVDMLRDGSAKVRVATLDALGCFGKRAGSWWDVVANHLGAGAWQERSAAALSLGELGEMKSVEKLISRMKMESGRLRLDIREALKRITRDDLGRNPKNWEDWWKKEKARNPKLKPPSEAREIPKTAHEYADQPTYYGIRVFSRGVGYVIDTSGSMAYRFKADPAWVKKAGRKYPAVAPKFDLAKNEIAASMKSLDPRVKVNVWFFRTDATQWKQKMVPADPNNVSSALMRVESQRPQPPRANSRGGISGSGKFRTNYVDVFRLILGLPAGARRPSGYRESPDTLFFLTDGKPTVGDITDPEILLAWLLERNRWARLELNVITYGGVESNLKFLEALAKQNGGKFVSVPSVD